VVIFGSFCVANRKVLTWSDLLPADKGGSPLGNMSITGLFTLNAGGTEVKGAPTANNGWSGPIWAKAGTWRSVGTPFTWKQNEGRAEFPIIGAFTVPNDSSVAISQIATWTGKEWTPATVLLDSRSYQKIVLGFDCGEPTATETPVPGETPEAAPETGGAGMPPVHRGGNDGPVEIPLLLILAAALVVLAPASFVVWRSRRPIRD
jgi:hypothetical protein